RAIVRPREPRADEKGAMDDGAGALKMRGEIRIAHVRDYGLELGRGHVGRHTIDRDDLLDLGPAQQAPQQQGAKLSRAAGDGDLHGRQLRAAGSRTHGHSSGILIHQRASSGRDTTISRREPITAAWSSIASMRPSTGYRALSCPAT